MLESKWSSVCFTNKASWCYWLKRNCQEKKAELRSQRHASPGMIFAHWVDLRSCWGREMFVPKITSWVWPRLRLETPLQSLSFRGGMECCKPHGLSWIHNCRMLLTKHVLAWRRSSGWSKPTSAFSHRGKHYDRAVLVNLYTMIMVKVKELQKDGCVEVILLYKKSTLPVCLGLLPSWQGRCSRSWDWPWL